MEMDFFSNFAQLDRYYYSLTWTSESRRLCAIWLRSERLRYFLLWNSFSSSSSCSLVKAVLRLLVLPGPRPVIPREQPPASISRGPWPSSSSSALQRDSLSSGISVTIRVQRLANALRRKNQITNYKKARLLFGKKCNIY